MPKKEQHKKAPGAPELPEDADVEEVSDAEETDSELGGSEDAGKKPASAKESDQPNDGNVKQVIESKQTDEAVEDIVRKEGDELLGTQDSVSASQTAALKKAKKPLLKRKAFWWPVVLTIIAAAVVLMAVPATRYAILNFLGVRVNASVIVVDRTTGQPLKNVAVNIGEVSADTDSKGEASLSGLKQGKQKLEIERIAFAKVEQDVTLGWGSNPLGTFRLEPSGAQYTFVISGFLSGEPIEGAEVTSGRAVASSDKDGKAVLTIPRTNESEVRVEISGDGYRTDEMTLQINTEGDIDVTLVPGNQAVFVASEGGRFNLYSVYADGQERSVLLEGTGLESPSMSLSTSTDGSRAALVSTREDIKANDGTLLESLTLVNTGDKGHKVLDRGEEIMLIDWVGTTLIYQMTVPGGSGDERQQLISYDYGGDKREELAKAAEFKSVASAQGSVYYSSGDGFVKVSPDGSGRQTALDADVSSAYRTAYDTLTLQAADGWYSFTISSSNSSKVSAPSSPGNRIYISDRAGDKSLWVDGSTLTLYNLSTSSDDRVHTQSGLAYPVSWLNHEAALYRVGNTVNAVNLSGGDPRKVADITPASGVVQTY